MPELIATDRLAELSVAELASAIKPLFEEAAWLAQRLAGRAFTGWTELIDASQAALQEATEAERAEVLRSHPRLGTPSDRLRQRSEMSWREQGGDRGPRTAPLEELSAANDRYEARFGFPFVDWVAGRPLKDMIVVIDSRLTSEPSAELCRGCRAIIDIARDRLEKIEGES